jgi:hypothetical protein
MSNRIRTAAAAVGALLLASCAQQGDVGPQGPSGPAGSPSGRLRAHANDGTDLGFVYATFPMTVTFGPTPAQGTVPMLLLKQQPPGNPLPEPVLVYRTPVTGEAVTCQILYESSDCTPTAGWPIVVAPASGNACLDPDGHAWVAAPGATARNLAVGSRRIALWDGPAQSVSGWSCQSGSTTLYNVFAGSDRGVPPAIASRIYYLPAD